MRLTYRCREFLGVAVRMVVLLAALAVIWFLTRWIWAATFACLIVALRLLRYWLFRHVPRRVILEIDFERGVIEQIPDDPIGRMSVRRALAVRDVVDAIHRAAGDRRVRAIFARIGSASLGMAHAQEIRDALAVFRGSGKTAIAFCETLGEGSAATVEYYLAAAFDQIHVQPSGDVGLTGLRSQQPFIRGLFDRLGILPRIDHREEYKAYKYLFTEAAMPEPHRQSLASILDSRSQQIVQAIAHDRTLTEEAVRELINRGPLSSQQALDAKLIDGIAFRDQVLDPLKKDLRAKIIDLGRYLARARRPHRRGHPIALIYGVGGVSRGKNGWRHFPSGAVMGSDDISAAFEKAIESKHIKAIVFRIDSPGGSVVASETIWRQVQRAREAGKPVIASMSNVAGSGGYYIAAPATRIVAQPGTITGSIGVVMGKLVTADAWRKAGINWQGVDVGANAAMWSSTSDFTEPQWAKVQAILDHVYADFKGKVAAGRNLSPEQVEAIAKGRIWTGQQAKDNGLVDELGGLERAIELARIEAKIPAGEPVRLLVLPRRRRWRIALRRSGSADAMAALAVELLQATEPAAQVLSKLSGGRENILSMPDLHL